MNRPIDSVPPITIQIAVAFHVSRTPQQFFAPDVWNSAPARETRSWMHANDLLSCDEPTDKLRAWVNAICSVPLPYQVWRVPPLPKMEDEE